jgi:Spy/CpxP family protein refolding chaperone
MFNRSKVWAAALLAATFLAGGTVGWAVRSSRPEHGPRVRGGGRGTEAMVAYLGKRLDLTAEQRDSVRAVFQRHRAAMDALWKDAHPRLDSLRQAMRGQIAAQLDSARRERYLRLLAKHEHRHRMRHGNDSTGGPH